MWRTRAVTTELLQKECKLLKVEFVQVNSTNVLSIHVLSGILEYSNSKVKRCAMFAPVELRIDHIDDIKPGCYSQVRTVAVIFGLESSLEVRKEARRDTD
jgi:hypothetical protein